MPKTFKDTILISADFLHKLNRSPAIEIAGNKIEMKVDVKWKYEAEKETSKEKATVEKVKKGINEFLLNTQKNFQAKFSKLDEDIVVVDSKEAAARYLKQAEKLVESVRTHVGTNLKKAVQNSASDLLKLSKGQVGDPKIKFDSPKLKLNKEWLKKLDDGPELVKVEVKKTKLPDLKFDLLSGVGTFKNIELPEKLLIKVKMTCEVDNNNIVKAAQLSEAASNEADYFRKQIKEGLLRTEKGIQKCMDDKDEASANALIKSINKQLALIKVEAVKNIEAKVKQKYDYFKGRDIDRVAWQVETTVTVVFAVVNIGLAAKDVFTEPPGLNLVKPIITVATNVAKIASTIKTAVTNVITLRNTMITDLEKLEKNRLLHLKTWEEKSKTEVVKDIFAQVKEALTDDIGSAEGSFKAFSSKVTGVLNESKELGKGLDQLLRTQDDCNKEDAKLLAQQIQPIIESIIETQKQFAGLEKEEEEFEKIIILCKRDVSVAVTIVKGLKTLNELRDPVALAEKACTTAISFAQSYAKN